MKISTSWMRLFWTASRTSSRLLIVWEILTTWKNDSRGASTIRRFPNARLNCSDIWNQMIGQEMTHEDDQMVATAANILARRGVAMCGDPDRRLDMLVSSQAELRSAWTTIESRCIGKLLLLHSILIRRGDSIPFTIANSESLNAAASDLGTYPPPPPHSRSRRVGCNEGISRKMP